MSAQTILTNKLAPPSPPAPPAAPSVVRIRATTGGRALDLVELWRYRELLGFLAMRDVKLRYKQTALGAAWAVIQPLLTMLVFSIFFGRLAKMPSDGVPYPLLTLVALLPWQLFVYALTQSSNSLVAEQRLITKVYFPRLIVPVASVLAGLVDFVIALLLLLVMIVIYIAKGWFVFQPSWTFALLPLFVIAAVTTALAIGLWLSALNVQYRDVRYVVPFLTQFWMFATPVAYPSSIVPEKWRALYGLNPMAGVVEGFRWAILGTASPSWGLMAVSSLVVVVLLVSGLLYFRRLERTFADVV
jgi:lipopolysaccharide transport system permease protein